MNFRLKTLFLGIMVLTLLGGCAPVIDLVDNFLKDKEELGPAELMEEGKEKFEKGYWKDAVEAFQGVKDRYPYSKYAIQAELKAADAIYQNEEFDEAFDAYDEFEKLHPRNKEVPYVIYQKGMCHFRQLKTIDRQQVHTLQAKEEFERLVKRFPRDKYADLARKKIRACLAALSEYELYVGNYYFKMGKYRAAMARYSYIIEHYPDMGHYHQALDSIVRAKEKLAEEQPPQANKS
ncbi:MAG: outer membrane protein assembly factor BamD [Pseudomonadota bacterium]